MLPVEIDKNKDIEETYENGIMKIVFHKSNVSTPKKINIIKS